MDNGRKAYKNRTLTHTCSYLPGKSNKTPCNDEPRGWDLCIIHCLSNACPTSTEAQPEKVKYPQDGSMDLVWSTDLPFAVTGNQWKNLCSRLLGTQAPMLVQNSLLRSCRNTESGWRFLEQ